MKIAPILRRAGWLGVIGILTPASAALRAEDAAAPDAPAVAALAAEAAKEATAANEAARAKEVTAPEAPAPPEAPPARPNKPRPPVPQRYGLAAGLHRIPGYQIHAHLAPVPKPLNTQLDLKGEGVLVLHVLPEGPAAKAGVKEDDIVIAAGDKAIKRLNDLTEAIEASDGKEMVFKVIRGGKPLEVKVTPEKSATGKIATINNEELLIDLENLEKSIGDKLKRAGVDMRVQLIKPGMVLPDGAKFSFHPNVEFPDDLSVTIRKLGKSPAEVEVKKGDKTWTLKDSELAQLPDGVREPVESLLGRGQTHLRILPAPPHVNLNLVEKRKWREPEPDGPREKPAPGGPDRHGPPGPPPRAGEGPLPEGPPPGLPGERPGPGPRARRPGGEAEHRADRARGNVERRLEALSRELDRLHQKLDGLRDSLGDEEEEEIEPFDE